MEFSHGCRRIDGTSNFLKTPDFSGSTFEKFPRLSKIFNGPRKSEKFQKNSKNYPKFPMLARKGRKCKKMRGKIQKIVGNFWNKFPEIPKYSEKIVKNIRKIPTGVKEAENAKNPIKSEKYQNIQNP